MKKTILTIVMATLWLIFTVTAQSHQPLTVGDQLPESLWKNVHAVLEPNGQQRFIKLDDYKGKLIIIDFWATWCSSCIAGFPNLEKLQNEFPDQLKTLLVTYEPSKAVQGFLEKRKAKTKELQLPTIVEDTLFHKLFPHHLIPHYVWINQSGTIINITATNAVNSGAIANILSGKKSEVQQKQDLDLDKPLFTTTSLPEQNLEYFSLLLKGYYPGLGSGASYRYQKDTLSGIALTNSSLLYLYKIAVKTQLPDYPDKRIIIDSSANTDPMIPKSHRSKNQTLYSYELRIPPSQSAQLYPQMLEQLNRLTPYEASLTRKRISCLVLKRTSSSMAPTRGGDRLNNLSENNELSLRNSPILALSGRLNNAFKTLILDETKIKYHIDLSLSIYEDDLKRTNSELARYGLILKPANRKTAVLLLESDKKSNQLKNL